MAVWKGLVSTSTEMEVMVALEPMGSAEEPDMVMVEETMALF